MTSSAKASAASVAAVKIIGKQEVVCGAKGNRTMKYLCMFPLQQWLHTDVKAADLDVFSFVNDFNSGWQ